MDRVAFSAKEKKRISKTTAVFILMRKSLCARVSKAVDENAARKSAEELPFSPVQGQHGYDRQKPWIVVVFSSTATLRCFCLSTAFYTGLQGAGIATKLQRQDEALLTVFVHLIQH